MRHTLLAKRTPTNPREIALFVTQLLDFHRTTIGPAVMEDGDEQDDADEGDDKADAETDEADDDGEQPDDLGDKGKQAIDRMKAARNSERDRRRALETELADLKAKGLKPDDADAVRAAADKAATEKANTRIIRSEVKAAAAGKLADPADAYRFLDLSKFEVDEDGEVDETEIADAIDELITSKPYLAAAQGGRRFGGTADGGARKETGPKQLTRADLAGMSPEAIEKARAGGQLKTLLSGK